MSRLYIGLGCRCDVAWQIRRRFELKEAYPFDWLVTPLKSVAALIENEFQEMANPDLLEVVQYGNGAGWTVRNTRYDIFLHHEFKREPDGKIVQNWREQCGEVEKKFKYLGDRFLKTLETQEEIVFLRRRGDFSMPDEAALPEDPAQILALKKALDDRTRKPQTLVLLNIAGVPAGEGVLSESVGPPTRAETPNPGDHWQGSTLSYDGLFDRLEAAIPTARDASSAPMADDRAVP